MNRQMRTASNRWLGVMKAARQRWNQLTDDDLADVRGNTERLISALQSRYGIARGQALKELAAWRQSLAQQTALRA
jgi:uncharacterized protein YjbJ (UPF0337 family)